MYPMLVRRENESHLAESIWKSQIEGLRTHSASTRVPVQGLRDFHCPSTGPINDIGVERDVLVCGGPVVVADVQGIDLSSSGHVSIVILSFP